MIVYWTMLVLPILFAMHPVRMDANLQRLMFWLAGIVTVVLIGYRHEVGGDWDRYISIYAYHKNTVLNFSNFTSGDYAYETIHWFSLNYLNGIYATNLICAAIFVYGLFKFCRTMPFPWLALFVSIPFPSFFFCKLYIFRISHLTTPLSPSAICKAMSSLGPLQDLRGSRGAVKALLSQRSSPLRTLDVGRWSMA